jgi:hypothetical protein
MITLQTVIDDTESTICEAIEKLDAESEVLDSVSVLVSYYYHHRVTWSVFLTCVISGFPEAAKRRASTPCRDVRGRLRKTSRRSAERYIFLFGSCFVYSAHVLI